ncbi:MAG TPA: right-handed parallel beta-helix repeat-containing protein [Candidatus Krumholzibacteria bacterium]|nr:right-handed parallel beta-helix repeat-containing protein [Candidatus Krumholzibacteria bacterium]HRX49799.1 right-handed parallel beta-helix repeat-containing protein [Candidatus Krumholzibacteria bacterium]
MFRQTLVALILCTALVAAPALAEWISPGNGTVYSMDGLVAASGGAVTGGAGLYEFQDSVVIGLGDRLEVAPGATLSFTGSAGLIGLEINGSLVALGTAAEPILMTGDDPTPGAWRGLDYQDGDAASEFRLAYVIIEYADIAVDVFGMDAELDRCEITRSADKAIDITQGNGVFTNCRLHHNQARTVTMTLTASPLFEDCVLDHNNLDNASPYPYFNIGLQGVNSPTIRGCTITGDGSHMSGGIAVWNASNAVIEGNDISGCGYGILCYSVGANPVIVGNTIWDNTIHPDQVNWGFGVACNGDNAPVLTENVITGHWYGVAAINGGRPNLGNLENADPADDGHNTLQNNGLGGAHYDFYNNTPLAQSAQNNFWTLPGEAGAEDCIVHQPDNAALGLVTFLPLGVVSAVEHAPAAGALLAATAHPNPFNPRVEIRLSLARESHVNAVVLDAAGRRVRELFTGQVDGGERVLTWDGTDDAGRGVASGLYFYRAVAGAESVVGKLVLVR